MISYVEMCNEMNSKTKTKLSPFIGIFSPLASTRQTPSSKHTSLHKSNALRHGIGSTNDTFCFCCRPGRKIGTREPREPRWEPQEPRWEPSEPQEPGFQGFPPGFLDLVDADCTIVLVQIFLCSFVRLESVCLQVQEEEQSMH